MTRCLVIGATGMLGQYMVREAAARGHDVTGTARTGADVALDLSDAEAIGEVVRAAKPDILVNCAAMANIDACDRDPAAAWLVNARAAGLLCEAAAETGAAAIHVSTEHYYSGDGDARHDEAHPVSFLNEYARTKFAGEAMTVATGALVLRTNIAGLRGIPDKPTLLEWLVDTARNRKPVTLFDDAFVSTIDCTSMATAAFDLLEAGARGLYNLASRDIFSKKALLGGIAAAIGQPLDHAETGSVRSLAVRRADSLGLDVGRAEKVLGRALPGLDEVIDNLAREVRSAA
jgi:dTDP-4-dehydrorhamnose reductase